MMNNYKPVKLDIGTFAENRFYMGDKVWMIQSLIEHSKDLEPFDMPICCIDTTAEGLWKGHCETIKHFAVHMRRVNKADLSYPIILSDNGFIMDGWHRIVKALVEGVVTIKAVRFDETPEPDYVEDAEDE